MIPRILLLLLLNSIGTTQNLRNTVQEIREKFQDATSKTGKNLLNYYKVSQARPHYDSLDKTEIEDEYDFIIIGSGSGGSVVANRLSEVPHWRILLVEIGEEPTKLNDIPGFGTYFLFTDYNWGYLMEREHMCLGCIKQRMQYPRGRVLGGSTIINYMMHIRGNRIDYDRWAAAGNPGWSYEDVLPYFKKSEDSHVVQQDVEYRSNGGYLGVQDVPYRTESANAFVRSMQEYGYSYVDYNGHQQMGVSYIQATLRRGRRSSARRAFIDTARMRPNLKIMTRTRVTKILINEITKKAFGVKLVHGKKTYYVKANKEVILSGGAFSSPQLLMLSGVGPKEHLEKFHIPVIKDLPVGKKMYDHLTYLGFLVQVNESIVTQASSSMDPNAFVELEAKGAGPLTSIGSVEAIAFVRTSVSQDPDPLYPDAELIFTGAGFQTDRGEFSRRTFRITDAQYNRIWRPLENKFAFTLWPMVFHPKSYGSVTLRSKNPYDRPRLHGNYFSDPEGHDMKTMIAAIREAQKVIKMPSFQRYQAELISVPVVGCEEEPHDSDEYWMCALRHIACTLHHQISTCRMGPANDTEAVVDHELRVHGIKNLRVVDTSVIPMPLSAHTNIPTYMIGEKASDIIKAYWFKKEEEEEKSDETNLYYNFEQPLYVENFN